MRHLFLIFVAFFCSAATAGVIRWNDRAKAATVDPMASAALFVGVRDFPYDNSLAPVTYAVDDAVDLAYELTLDRPSALIDPKRVFLALSGEPEKAQSQEKLKALLGAGASRKPAGLSDILTYLESQSLAVGPDGILIVAFATHGVSREGVQHLLTASSLLQHLGTTLTDGEIEETISRNGVGRSLILIDACRERLIRDRRAGEADPRAVAGFVRAMSGVSGQAVITAAVAGGYAYDDDGRRNGVFTATVIDGLHCKAARNVKGFVTAETLRSYVEKNVLSWLRANKDRGAQKATQARFEGDSKEIPLSICVSRTASVPGPHSP